MWQPRENPDNEGGGRYENDLSNSHIAKQFASHKMEDQGKRMVRFRFRLDF